MRTDTTVARSQRRLWVPLAVSMVWMLGTFGAFWLTPRAELVPNPGTLTSFVLAATAAFAVGYAARIRRYGRTITVPARQPASPHRIRTLVAWSALYYMAWGLALIVQFGGTDPVEVVARIADPGRAYASKFDTYALDGTNPLIQVLTLGAVLSTVLVPVAVLYWRQLSFLVRLGAVVGIGAYITFFLYVGTLKGLGDVVVMGGAAAAVATLGTWRARTVTRNRRRSRALVLAALALAGFATYMVAAQASRLEQYNAEHLFPPDPVVADILGDRMASGAAATMFYPTHGYLGLAYNLETPFVWTAGLGSSRALTSYVDRYVEPTDGYANSYPARTQARTGYPAGQYWATIYPWLASDLTWPGVVLFMTVFGWWFARLWVEAAILRRNLSLLLWAQLCITVAYLPANNQLGISAPSLIAFATLVTVYAWRHVNVRRATALAPPAPVKRVSVSTTVSNSPRRQGDYSTSTVLPSALQ